MQWREVIQLIFGKACTDKMGDEKPLQGTALHEISLQRLTARDQAVVVLPQAALRGLGLCLGSA